MSCLGLLLAGCGGPLEVDAPELSGSAASTCDELVGALPETVDDVERREVEPAGAPAAAWGEPAIVLRCGVEMPPAFDDFSTCQETNGVGWYIPDEQMTGSPTEITMTTIGRDVNIEVALPEEHFPPANAMVDLADAIKQTTEEIDPCV
ncbi:MAG TPA: DUF3515 domain-containing protein [Nocardioidaceae bacterium]|nr:DUF3515 domain-containing protein [Nocardioidaceae bacterium]